MSTHELAFRRFVCRFEEEISKEQRQQLIYIRLYPQRDKYWNASTLEVLAKLEAECIFGPNRIEGLLEIAKDIGHKRLEKETKDFIKRRSKEEKKAVKRTSSNPGESGSKGHLSHEELQLRITLEVALAQLTVLMRQIDTFQRKLEAASRAAEIKTVFKAMHEASQTAVKLAHTLLPDKEQEASEDSSGSDETTSPSSTLERYPFYENIEGPLPVLSVRKPPVVGTSTGDLHQKFSPKHQRPRNIPEPDLQSPLVLHSTTASVQPPVVEPRKKYSTISSLSMKPKRYAGPHNESTEEPTHSTPASRGPPPPVKPKPAIASTYSKHSTGSQPKRSDRATLNAEYATQPEAGDYTGGSTGDSGFEDIEKLRERIHYENHPLSLATPEQSHYYKSLEILSEDQASEEAHDYMSMQTNQGLVSEDLGQQTEERVRLQPLTPSIIPGVPHTLPESHTEFIDPVEVIHCDSSGGIYHNPLHGITLRIPEKAIPPGEHLEINIGVCLYGNFIFSDNLTPVSAILWLCSKAHIYTVFAKPIEIVIPHFLDCKSKEDAANLEMKFMKASHRNSTSEALQFLPVDGETDFTSVPYKGILHTRHFCYLCISAGVLPDQLMRRRFCIACATPRSITTGSTIYFYILYFLDTCIQSLEKQLADGYCLEEPRVFRMSHNAHVAAITGEYQYSTTKKAVVLTLQPTRIPRDMIDFWQLHQDGELALMEKMKMYPPSMKLKFGDLSSCEEQVVTVLFTGTQEPEDQMKIEIIVPSSSNKETPHDSKISPIHCTKMPTLTDTPTLRQLWRLDTELEETPVCLLTALAPRWTDLGIAIDFDPQGRHLRLIKEECCFEGPMACCRKILSDWLCGKGSYQPPTWENMLKILKDLQEENLVQTLHKLLS